jgi:hypothetical protein
MPRLAIATILLALAALPACTTLPTQTPVRVKLTFENMRRFVDEKGEPISSRDEWALVEDLIEDLKTHYHVRSNRFGSDFAATREVSQAPPPSLQVATYTVDLVLSDLDQIPAINERVNALRGRRFGPSREASQVDPYAATIAYRSGFLRADLRVVLSGDADPGTLVYLYDAVLDEPRRVVAAEGGRWESAVNIADGQRNVYGYFMDARARLPVYFRVNIGTRVFQEIDRATIDADFPRDYRGRPFRPAPDGP